MKCDIRDRNLPCKAAAYQLVHSLEYLLRRPVHQGEQQRRQVINLRRSNGRAFLKLFVPSSGQLLCDVDVYRAKCCVMVTAVFLTGCAGPCRTHAHTPELCAHFLHQFSLFCDETYTDRTGQFGALRLFSYFSEIVTCKNRHFPHLVHPSTDERLQLWSNKHAGPFTSNPRRALGYKNWAIIYHEGSGSQVHATLPAPRLFHGLRASRCI